MNGSLFSKNVAVVNALEGYLHRLECQKPPQMTFTYKTKRKLMVFNESAACSSGIMVGYRVAVVGFRVLTMKDDDHRGEAQCKCLSR